LLEVHAVDLVIDVGANTGQYGRRLRNHGYKGQIVSLEPIRAAFEELSAAAGRDQKWLAIHTAAGAKRGEATINISAASETSSLLPMSTGAEAVIGAEYVASERVRVDRLDALVSGLPAERPFLKIDVQGSERAVLEGATGILHRLVGLEMEISFTPLYERQTLWREDIDYLDSAGFRLVNLTPGFRDRTSGELLQADGLFVRSRGN
jgi:FkbM family methyltransferase